MDHADHVDLLRGGVAREPGTWADLGAGAGAFTLALGDLLPPGSVIYAVDKDRGALAELEASSPRGGVRIEPRRGDFTKELGLPPLDGIVMANSLHFVKDKAPVLAQVRAMLRPGAPLLLVEYDADRGNPWVPYPFSFETWRELAVASGFAEPRLLATRPSRFLRRIYSAATATGRS
ncbi:MAG TPA: class I SAM-dependent methyltransferase [Candidatus Limnocylindria bacterium]|nr:class I SAM-dependent methyltransferase [Candidatus Limnocylindria bacterium]